ncbi:MAG: insulinase family protein [Bifidobacteriaceae bacterium]|nr:insulinase family protein [Bifidobacteriaceae bacterium]
MNGLEAAPDLGAWSEADPAVEHSVLPTGVRVVTQGLPHARSFTVGFWVLVGSRDEVAGQFGSTHFLEHLLFKGTKTRTAEQIAVAFDSIGGEFNAATAKESTCYFARVLADRAAVAIELLADMLTSSVLDRRDFETERGVILEELAMNQDDPTDVAHEAFAAAVYGDHPLARPIGGRPADIEAVSRDSVWDHYVRHYRPERLVVIAAGQLDHRTVVSLVAEALERGGWGPAAAGEHQSAPLRPVSPQVALPTEGRVEGLARPTEQAQVLIGCEGLIATDERRHALAVLGSVLGGGMSSRLFQEIREKRGLAYSTYCFTTSHSDAGSFGVYAGCTPAAAAEVTALMESQWECLGRDGLRPGELERVKGQITGATLLSLEEPYSPMNRLGRAATLMGELPPIEEIIARIEAVTADQVRSLAADLASRPRSRVIVGPPP